MDGFWAQMAFNRVPEFPKWNPNEGVVQVASHEENQQLAALAAATTITTFF